MEGVVKSCLSLLMLFFCAKFDVFLDGNLGRFVGNLIFVVSHCACKEW